MQSLYELSYRQVGFTTFVSVICNRGDVTVASSEKAIPPIIEYNEDGDFIAYGAEEVLDGITFHPYKANSSDFNEARLADLEVASLYKQLEHFPTLPKIYEGSEAYVHPVAELIYSSFVYLKPSMELDQSLKSMDYIKKSKALPVILEKVAEKVEKEYGVKLDLFSVPKRKVGTFAYIADNDGIASIAKLFSFGMHRLIPADRIAREISSLKACERFLDPVSSHLDLPEDIKPYVSVLRVAIVATKESMLDSGDLYESALPKIASRLSRKKIIKDVSLVEEEERNLVFKPFRSGIEVYHEEETFIDEREVLPGTIRLILPGGVKVAAQYTGKQLKDSKGENVDTLISFESFAKKGALCCFLFDSKEDTSEFDTEKAIEYFKTLKTESVYLDGTEYKGYIVNLPVMRPGQRYTELSKASDQITVDLIAKAILKKKYIVKPHLEEEYTKLKQLRQAIIGEILQTHKQLA